MSSLKKLGIEMTYNPEEPEELSYAIHINPERLKNPGQAQKYFRKIINRVSIDARKNKGLDNLIVSVNDRYLQSLHNVAKDLFEKSEKQLKITHSEEFGDRPLLFKISVGGGAVVVGLAGLILGYDQVTELATNVADYMNNASHLLAPITGVVQTGISIVGTAATTVMGAIGGAVGGVMLSLPYMIPKYPLGTEDHVKRYKSLEAALEKAIPGKKQSSN